MNRISCDTSLTIRSSSEISKTLKHTLKLSMWLLRIVDRCTARLPLVFTSISKASLVASASGAKLLSTEMRKLFGTVCLALTDPVLSDRTNWPWYKTSDLSQRYQRIPEGLNTLTVHGFGLQKTQRRLIQNTRIMLHQGLQTAAVQTLWRKFHQEKTVYVRECSLDLRFRPWCERKSQTISPKWWCKMVIYPWYNP